MTITRSRASRLTAGALIVATLVLGTASSAVAATTKARPKAATTKKKPTTTTTAKKAAAPAAAITAQNFAFSPAVLRVAKGTTVTLANKDGAPHTWAADGGQWDSGVIAGGGKFSRKFDDVGTFAFHCNIHTSMKGTVEVG